MNREPSSERLSRCFVKELIRVIVTRKRPGPLFAYNPTTSVNHNPSRFDHRDGASTNVLFATLVTINGIVCRPVQQRIELETVRVNGKDFCDGFRNRAQASHLSI